MFLVEGSIFKFFCLKIGVAPYVGAWIEITIESVSMPTGRVAPYVGAWIEILGADRGGLSRQVAPYVGAWIEILQLSY